MTEAIIAVLALLLAWCVGLTVAVRRHGIEHDLARPRLHRLGNVASRHDERLAIVEEHNKLPVQRDPDPPTWRVQA